MNIETVWTQYQTELRRFLASRVSEPADIDDILQDTLVKTYQHLHTLGAEHSLKSWLFQITNRTLIDFYRKKGRAAHTELTDLSDEKSDLSTSQEIAQCVEPFLSGLSDESRELLLAVDIHGKAQKELAQEKGIPYTTLKSRVKKARTELKSLFTQCCRFTVDSRGNLLDAIPKTGTPSNCSSC